MPKRRQFGRFGARLRRNQIEAGVGRQGDLERDDQATLGDVGFDIGGSADGNADPVDRGLHGHQDQVEGQAGLFGNVGRQAGRREPQPPVVVIAAARMQQRVVGEVFRNAAGM